MRSADSQASAAITEKASVLSQLSTFVALHEDIQCRYNLGCNRLTSLLSAIESPQNNNAHTKYYLRKGRKPEEDAKIQQAYQDCIQLQLQLNLAQSAIERLQKALSIQQISLPQVNQNMAVMLKQASTDKLRFLAEFLIDTLLSMSLPSASIPQLPVTMHAVFTPQMCESLFRYLCINSTRQMQIHAGSLLVRLCGNQNWWGNFLGNILMEYFSCEQQDVFPQDRVFVLLTALGQKSLSGTYANNVLESILTLLGRLLAPLLNQYQSFYRPNAGKFCS